MNYYRAIKIAYPDILDSEFSLRDDGDGVYISSWTYGGAPQPELNTLPVLEADKADKIDALEVELASNISKPITVTVAAGSSEFVVDSFNLAMMQSMINGYANLTNKDVNGDINWWLADNTVIKVNDTDLQAVLEAYAIRAGACIDHAESLRTQINAAVDQQALDAIDITAGWPS